MTFLFDKYGQRCGVHLMFHGQAAAFYFGQGIGPAQIYRVLGQDGASIEALIHQMHRDFGFGQLVLEGPLVGVQALVLVGVGGVNVQDTAGEGANEGGRQNAHVAGQHHVIGLELLQYCHHLGIELDTLAARRC